MLLHRQVDDAHEVGDIPVVVGDLHPLPAQHIGWAHQHGVANLVGRRQRLLGGEHSAALGPGDAALVQDLIKPLPVLGGVHAVGGGA